MKICVVIAAYDERDNVGPLTERIRAALDGEPGSSWELIYVVEGTDGTRDLVEDLSRSDPRIRLLYEPVPAGLGRAFRRGFGAVPADADVVVTLDADLNHQPEEIPRLVRALAGSDADVVVGSRFVEGSHVEGTPMWKRALSGTMNGVIRHLYGLRVLDKTSGFRAYRAEVVRSLRFTNDDFAFLPEILIRLQKDGRRIVEEPIRFVYRTRGESKMAIARTVRSYGRLLLRQWDGISALAVASFLAGVAVRAFAAWPAHRYPNEADAVLPGIGGLRILSGHPTVFHSGFRIGALDSYLHAVVFLVAGASRATLAVAPFVFGVALLLVFHRLALRLFDRRIAAFCLLVLAIPTPAFLFWTYVPIPYGFLFLLGALTLLAAARVADGIDRATSWAAFGLVSGLGAWSSFLNLSYLGAGLVWIAWKRGFGLPGRRTIVGGALAAGAFLVGFAPWISFNVRYGFPSLHKNFASRPVQTLAAGASNLERLFTYQLPATFLDSDPTRPGRDGTTPILLRGLSGAAGVVYLAAAYAAFVTTRAEIRRRARPPGLALLGLAALVAAAFFVVSEAASYGGFSVRYTLTVYFLGVAAAAILLERASRSSRLAAAALAAPLVAFHLLAWPWWFTAAGERLMSLARQDDSERAFLQRQGVDLACGSYWDVFPLNFHAWGSIRAIAANAGDTPVGFLDYGAQLSDRPGRWALVGTDASRLDRWAARAGLTGHAIRLSPDRAVLLPDPPPRETPSAVLARLRSTPP